MVFSCKISGFYFCLCESLFVNYYLLLIVVNSSMLLPKTYLFRTVTEGHNCNYCFTIKSQLFLHQLFNSFSLRIVYCFIVTFVFVNVGFPCLLKLSLLLRSVISSSNYRLLYCLTLCFETLDFCLRLYFMSNYFCPHRWSLVACYLVFLHKTVLIIILFVVSCRSRQIK